MRAVHVAHRPAQLVATFLLDQSSEAVDRAQRRAQVVGDRIRDGLHVLHRALQFGGALGHASLQAGVEFAHLLLRHHPLLDVQVGARHEQGLARVIAPVHTAPVVDPDPAAAAVPHADVDIVEVGFTRKWP